MASSPPDPDKWAAGNADPDAWAAANASKEHTVVQAHVRPKPSQDWRLKAADTLPFIGGGVGGGLGAAAGAGAGGIGAIPGGFAGAAGGGALGEGARDLVYRMMGEQAPSLLREPVEMAKAAGTQALYHAGGEALQAVPKLIAKPLMQWALRSSPEVAQTAIREGILGTKAGLTKLMGKIGDAGDALKGILNRAGSRGTRYQAQDLIDEVNRRIVPDISGQAHVQDDLAAVNLMNKKFIADQSQLIHPNQLLSIKQNSDAIADPLHRAVQRSEPITAADNIRLKWHKAMADVAREHINGIEDPGLTDLTRSRLNNAELANQHTGELIRAADALKKQVQPNMGFAARLAGRSVGPMLGASVGAWSSPQDRGLGAFRGAVAGATMTSPALLSGAAQGLSSPILAALLRQTPRVIGVASQP